MKIITKLEAKDHSFNEEEWLVTNGIGGFACGAISGTPFRRYHSFLNAALPAPFGRTNMLNFISETIILPDQTEFLLSSLKTMGNEKIPKSYLIDFRLENGLPIWRYDIKGIIIEKDLFLVNGQNTLHTSFRLLSETNNILIKWHPFFHFRTFDQPISGEMPDESYTVISEDSRYQIECPHFPSLKIYNSSHPQFVIDYQEIKNSFYKIEADRGYDATENLKSPGYFLAPLVHQERNTFIVSTEDWKTISALSNKRAFDAERIRRRDLIKAAGPAIKIPAVAKLVLAADQFIISPNYRLEDMIRMKAMGHEVKSIIAGFPWFTDWGRDTMISLEGLTLTTGRSKEAYAILFTFAYYVRDGLIPNMFPEGQIDGRYNTADATLWFFHAIDRYVSITGDDDILEFLLPILRDIILHHVKGTHFGIKMDEDGLLMQGEQGVQLTWMDAKVGDWVVTPRRGKAVEINALWYNALKLYEKWSEKPFEFTQLCFESFNKKFWFAKGNYLYDVIDGEEGNDNALRPNQLFAISLSNPVLKKEYWKPVFDIVTKELLTPVGLRTLSPFHKDYKSTYDGDLRARDAAYHQGTVWPWLLGPYMDVCLKIQPEFKESATIFKAIEEHLNANCIGSLSEIFDACPPYKARGCFAQAWSVAELLRILVKTNSHEK